MSVLTSCSCINLAYISGVTKNEEVNTYALKGYKILVPSLGIGEYTAIMAPNKHLRIISISLLGKLYNK